MKLETVEDAVAAVRRCIAAGDDLARAYQLVGEYLAVDFRNHPETNWSWQAHRELKGLFVAATAERIGDAHPFRGKSKFHRWIGGTSAISASSPMAGCIIHAAILWIRCELHCAMPVPGRRSKGK